MKDIDEWQLSTPEKVHKERENFMKYKSDSKMPKQLKTKWVQALRSGEFKKTVGALERKESGAYVGNCCLGVLCRIAKIRPDKYIPAEGVVRFRTNFGVLADELLQRFGLGIDDSEQLAALNDGIGNSTIVSFKQIANFIEKNIGTA